MPSAQCPLHQAHAQLAGRGDQLVLQGTCVCRRDYLACCFCASAMAAILALVCVFGTHTREVSDEEAGATQIPHTAPRCNRVLSASASALVYGT